MPEGTFDPLELLSARFVAAIRAAAPGLGDGPVDPMISPGKQAKLGDFQCNAAMPLAKRLGLAPRDLAAQIVRHADLGDLADPLTDASIAGPGFINVRLRGATLALLIDRFDTPSLGVPAPAAAETVVVDLCGVNLAKEMHVGHLRSTVIGDCLARVFTRLGHRVIRQNHVGDWGLPIAMVTGRLMELEQAGRLDLASITLARLTEIYREAQADCTPDASGLAAARRFGLGPKVLAELEEQASGAEAARAASRRTLVALQGGDPRAARVWRRIYDVTMGDCQRICDRLGTAITTADAAGESSYAAELSPMVDDLVGRGVAVESDGALVVRLDEAGIDVPAMVRKSDGGFTYATTDVAAIRRRVRVLGADRVVYVIGSPQALHLRQVFAAADKAGYTSRPGRPPARLDHAAFGSVLGDDGRMLKTRSGENVRLADLLDEAAARAERVVADKNPGLDAAERRRVAEAVAVAAIKFADLSGDRVKDYVFSYDRMLAFEGSTGPALLYALVRVRSIARKASERGLTTDPRAGLVIEQPAEKTLALTILRYPGVVGAVAASLEPHRLCQYLYELAGAFGSFFDDCPVLQADTEAVRASRLRLTAVTGRVLADGLAVLGLPALERM